MKRPGLVACLLLGACHAAPAQIPHNDPYLESGLRIDAAAVKKASRQWSFKGGAEMRMAKFHLADERFDLYSEAAWRCTPWLKLQGEYRLEALREYRSDIELRSRLQLSCAGIYKTGKWKLSATQTIQGTFMGTDRNVWTKPALRLKSRTRLKAEYHPARGWTLPLGAELRLALNDPAISRYEYDAASWQFIPASGVDSGSPGWFLDGFYYCHPDRLRLFAGAEVKLSARNSISLTFMGDQYNDFKFKASRDGSTIKYMVYDCPFRISLKLGYQYSF